MTPALKTRAPSPAEIAAARIAARMPQDCEEHLAPGEALVAVDVFAYAESSTLAQVERRHHRRRSSVRLFTARDMASACECDLKTIHNWIARHNIPHFLTPGRHVRFKVEDARAFLTKMGYPLPESLR